jgi:hypothetical protein
MTTVHNGSLHSIPGAPAPTRVDLERREDRFVVYIRDTPELIEELERHTRPLAFPDTPVTRTVYFGDVARGLPPGLSVKARGYERERLPGRWDLTTETGFELLEIKRTVDSDPRAASPKRRSARRRRNKSETRDSMVEILRLSDAILGRDTHKSKQRRPRPSLADITRIIGNPRAEQETIDHSLYVYLLETVGAFEDFRWLPVIGTDYERTHFVGQTDEYRDAFRATLDTRVTHYAFDERDGGFEGVPVGTEGFSRFEVKVDKARVTGTPLGDWLKQTITRFRAFRIPSKKYRGMRLRSAHQIRREGFLDELPGSRLSTEFASRPVRYKHHEHYVNLARYLESSKTFRPYFTHPVLLEEHEHSVQGEYKGLSIAISGAQLTYWRPRAVIATKPVPIFTRDVVPVTCVPLVSRDDLERLSWVTKMKRGHSQYKRSRGFLVENRRSGRIYRVALERRAHGSKTPEYFVVIEYVGRARGRMRFDAAPIVKDLGLLHRFLLRDPLLKPHEPA